VLHATEPINEAIIKELLEAREAMLRIRILMRQMGEGASVPVSDFCSVLIVASDLNGPFVHDYLVLLHNNTRPAVES